MQNQVALSIVIPVFNHADDLKTMLDSVLTNTFQDWELLAVDDGSEQDTLTLLEEYAVHDKRICIIHRDKTPKGAQTCRNIGLELAQGEFVIFFDSDDYIAPYCLEQRVKELSEHPELDFMVFRSGTYHDNTFFREPNKFNYGYPIYKDDIKAFCTRTMPFIVWNNIYRRASLLEHNIRWDTNLLSLQDAQFNIECLVSDMKYLYSTCPPDYGYRIETQGSISKKIMSKGHFNSNVYATERFYTLIKNKYGNKYDHSLYRGAMFVYVKISRTGFQADFNKRLANTISRFSLFWGSLFKLQIFLTHIFGKIMPFTPARRMPVLNYLIWYRRWEKWVTNKQKELL